MVKMKMLEWRMGEGGVGKIPIITIPIYFTRTCTIYIHMMLLSFQIRVLHIVISYFYLPTSCAYVFFLFFLLLFLFMLLYIFK